VRLRHHTTYDDSTVAPSALWLRVLGRRLAPDARSRMASSGLGALYVLRVRSSSVNTPAGIALSGNQCRAQAHDIIAFTQCIAVVTQCMSLPMHTQIVRKRCLLGLCCVTAFQPMFKYTLWRKPAAPSQCFSMTSQDSST
jgi:hypothetical protein